MISLPLASLASFYYSYWHAGDWMDIWVNWSVFIMHSFFKFANMNDHTSDFLALCPWPRVFSN